MSAYIGDVVKNGLVLYLDAANSKSYVSGSNTWFDLSGNNNSGSLTNGPTFSSDGKGSIVFDGSNDYVSVAQQPSLVNAGQFTLSAWMKRRLSNSKVICYQGATTTNDVAFELWDDGNAYFEIGNGSNSFGYVSNNSIQWQQLIMVFDGSQTGNSNRLKAYINGTLQTLTYFQTIPSTTGLSNSVFSIGNSQGIGGNFSDGSIAQVSMYNRALSAAEILENYNATKGRFDTPRAINSVQPRLVTNGLVMCLDAGNRESYVSGSSTWLDLSGNNNSGSLINGPTFVNNYKGYLTFDGTDDYCTTPAIVQAAANSTLQTLCGWLIGEGSLFGTNASSNGQMHLKVILSGSILTFRETYYGGSGGETSDSASISPKTNNFIALVKTSAQKYDVYFNGEKVMNQVTKTAVNNTSFYPGLYYSIGATRTLNAGSVAGYLIYNRALSASEVLQNYNALKGRFGL